MTRRVSLPGAAELFRTTGGEGSGSGGEARGVGADGVGADGVETRSAGWPDAEGLPTDRLHNERLHALPLAEEPATVGLRSAARSVRAVARGRRGSRGPSGRERHEEKITVYVSAEELLDLEHARLSLRSEHGLAVDRGRIVREAVAMVIAELDGKGEGSVLVRRLRGL